MLTQFIQMDFFFSLWMMLAIKLKEMSAMLAKQVSYHTFLGERNFGVNFFHSSHKTIRTFLFRIKTISSVLYHFFFSHFFCIGPDYNYFSKWQDYLYNKYAIKENLSVSFVFIQKVFFQTSFDVSNNASHYIPMFLIY